MDAKLFKSFTPYILTGKQDHQFKEAEFYDFADEIAEDPGKTMWSSIGFMKIDGEAPVIDVQGAGFVAVVEIAERILPASVQKEKIKVRVDDIQERDGRKVGKKEYAQIRDEVILELLPVALIRRKRVPLLFTKGRILMFGTSAKTCDDIMLLLGRSFSGKLWESFKPLPLVNLVNNNVVGTLTALSKEGETSREDQHGEVRDFFSVDNSILLKGASKQSIRVKDKDVNSADVQNLLKQEYDVMQLGLNFYQAGSTDADASFVLTDKMTFVRLALSGAPGTSEADEKDKADAFLSHSWLTARLGNGIVDLAIDLMGGLSDGTKPTKEDKLAPELDIDDL